MARLQNYISQIHVQHVLMVAGLLPAMNNFCEAVICFLNFFFRELCMSMGTRYNTYVLNKVMNLFGILCNRLDFMTSMKKVQLA